MKQRMNVTHEQLGIMMGDALIDAAKKEDYTGLRIIGATMVNDHLELAKQFGNYKRKAILDCLVLSAGCSLIAFILGYAKCLVDNKEETEDEE